MDDFGLGEMSAENKPGSCSIRARISPCRTRTWNRAVNAKAGRSAASGWAARGGGDTAPAARGRQMPVSGSPSAPPDLSASPSGSTAFGRADRLDPRAAAGHPGRNMTPARQEYRLIAEGTSAAQAANPKSMEYKRVP